MAENVIDDWFNADSFTPKVKGRLKERLDFWKEIGASNWVIKILSQGYALPFTSEPEPSIFRNNFSALHNADFVTKEILDLLDSGRVREVNLSEVHTLNPLSVADNGEKLRLILDLRYINKFLQVPNFKCEDIRLIKDLFNIKLMTSFSSLIFAQGIIVSIFIHNTRNSLSFLGLLMDV